MKSFKFLLFRGQHKLSWHVEAADDVTQFAMDISLCFAQSVNPVNNELAISCRQVSSPALKERINVFIGLYKEIDPRIYKIKTFINQIPEGEHFFFLPNMSELSSDAELMATVELMALDAGQDPDQALAAFKDNLGPFFDNYKIDGRIAEKKIAIGEPLKKNRVCRFCYNTRPSTKNDSAEKLVTTFKQEAHAISEALGNKTVILNEECDACNTFFAESCERDIYTYLRCLGTFFRVKNKDNTVSSIIGKNFKLIYLSEDRKNKLLDAQAASGAALPNDEAANSKEPLSPEALQQISTLDFCLQYTLEEGERAPENGPPELIPLKFKEQLSMQQVYKALVKFALSVMETENLAGFEKTIEWVAGDQTVAQLPKIATLRSYAHFSKGAELTIYRRTTDDGRLPLAIGEFQFTFQKMVFIIPSFNDAESSFVDDSEYQHFWDFSFFKSVQGWSFQDFSDNQKKDFIFNMSLSEMQSRNTGDQKPLDDTSATV
jgi:hypothetical protein